MMLINWLVQPLAVSPAVAPQPGSHLRCILLPAGRIKGHSGRTWLTLLRISPCSKALEGKACPTLSRRVTVSTCPRAPCPTSLQLRGREEVSRSPWTSNDNLGNKEAGSGGGKVALGRLQKRKKSKKDRTKTSQPTWALGSFQLFCLLFHSSSCWKLLQTQSPHVMWNGQHPLLGRGLQASYSTARWKGQSPDLHDTPTSAPAFLSGKPHPHSQTGLSSQATYTTQAAEVYCSELAKVRKPGMATPSAQFPENWKGVTL